MFTLTLVALHAFRINTDFCPEILYFGTILLDILLLDTIIKVVGQ